MIDAHTDTDQLSMFDPVAADEIRRLLGQVPAKQCALDPAPTWLIKLLVIDICPVISHLCNISLQSSHLPVVRKLAIIQIISVCICSSRGSRRSQEDGGVVRCCYQGLVCVVLTALERWKVASHLAAHLWSFTAARWRRSQRIRCKRHHQAVDRRA